jgi:hypothetical protein
MRLWIRDILIDTMRHYLSEYVYCTICRDMTFDEQMNECKRAFVETFRVFSSNVTSSDRAIILAAKQELIHD